MVEHVRESVGGDVGGTYTPLTEAELSEVERIVAVFLGPDQNRSAAAERALSALVLDYLPRLVAQVRALQREGQEFNAEIREALGLFSEDEDVGTVDRIRKMRRSLDCAIEEMVNVYRAPPPRRREFLAEALRSFGVDPKVLTAPAERTPEVVLPAMIKSYGVAIGEAELRLRDRPNYVLSLHAARLRESLNELVRGLIDVSTGRGPNLFQDDLSEDYEARLSGARALDAPPPGNRFPGGT